MNDDPSIEHPGCRWMVEKLDGAHVGHTALLRHGADLELGYILRQAHWGQGFATETARAVLDHVRDTAAPHRHGR